MPNVAFLKSEPADNEFFEEYNKFNTPCNSWFILVFILRCFAAFCLGYQVGVFESRGGVKAYIREYNYSSYAETEMANETNPEVLQMSTEKSLIVRMLKFKHLGFALGAAFGGVFADIFGRRITSFLTSVVWIIGAGVFPTLNNITLIEIWYVLLTTCASVVNVTTFVNIAEIINYRYRILIIYSINTYVAGDFLIKYITTTLESWKYALTFVTSTLTCTVFATWYSPESPRWLLNKNRRQEAYDQLSDISQRIYDIQVVEAPNNVTKMKILVDMMKYLFKRRLKQHLVCNVLLSVSSLNYSFSKQNLIMHTVKTASYEDIANIAEALGFLTFLPVYALIGKKYGLCFCFLFLTITHFTGIFVNDKAHEVFYDFFGTMLGILSLCICWLYCLEYFPTFLRATATGGGFYVFNLSSGLSFLFIPLLEETRGFIYYLTFFIISLFGAVVFLLPVKPNQELSNTKLHL
ncbi:glucose transporter GlcP-like [Zophobas morio]|uniref:glucose transporter GlcP-like n=1 Tax=Zophobas morio TaxID=2755281 RepID=UPI00308377C3